jgi:hypothetical protein
VGAFLGPGWYRHCGCGCNLLKMVLPTCSRHTWAFAQRKAVNLSVTGYTRTSSGTPIVSKLNLLATDPNPSGHHGSPGNEEIKGDLGFAGKFGIGTSFKAGSAGLVKKSFVNGE